MKHENSSSTAHLRCCLYARISQDPKLTGLGVERQLEDCRAFVEDRGWTIVAEYVENDTSAYSGKRRPQYEAMLDAIKNDQVDIVVAHHTDRIHRRLRDLVEYTDIVRDQRGNMKVATHTVKAGDIDLSTPSGIMIAHIKGAVDEAYVSEAREKNKRGRLQIAQKGGRHKCARVYGWEDDGLRVRESEAKVIREIVERLIDGQSPTAVANVLNAREVLTVTGARWSGLNIRKCAERASNAGLRSHQGEIYQGNWEPIIDRTTWEHACLILKDRLSLKYKRGVGRKYLLTGFAVCGNCGNKLSATVGASGRVASYRCKKAHSSDVAHEHGCGVVSRAILPLEQLVSEAILFRLDSPALGASIAQQTSQRTDVTDLLLERQTQQGQLDELVSDYYTNKIMTRAQFLNAKARVDANLDAMTKQLNAMTSRQTVSTVDLTGTLRETWQTASIEWKRNLVEMLIEKVVVLPYEEHFKVVWYGKYRFDPKRVEIRWLV